MKARRALVYVTVWSLDMADRGAGRGGKSLEGPLDSDWRATEDDWADFLATGPDLRVRATDSTSSRGRWEDSNRSSLSYTISSLFLEIDFLTDFFWLREVIRERNINVE